MPNFDVTLPEWVTVPRDSEDLDDPNKWAGFVSRWNAWMRTLTNNWAQLWVDFADLETEFGTLDAGLNLQVETSYTPTYYNITAPTTVYSGYRRMYGMCFYYGRMRVGAFAPTGNISIGLPFAPLLSGQVISMSASGFDSSANLRYQDQVFILTGPIRFEVLRTGHSGGGNNGLWNATRPFTWAINDDVDWAFWYPVA